MDLAWIWHGIAWNCIVLHGIARYCRVLHCIALYCMVLHGIAWYCMILHGITWYCMVLHDHAPSCLILHHLAPSCRILHHLAPSCTILHYLALSCTILHYLAVMSCGTHKIYIKLADESSDCLQIALWPLYTCSGSESESPVLRTGVIWKSGVVGGWITSRSGWLLELLTELKMAIILPTGQWYAPSAVINVPWYCMVLHGIAWYCIVLQGIP